MNTTPIHQLSLAGVVLLSLVLPWMAATLGKPNFAGTKPWRQTVWAGQAVGAFGGLLIIFSPLHAYYGLGIAVAGCALFGSILHRQLIQFQSGEG